MLIVFCFEYNLWYTLLNIFNSRSLNRQILIVSKNVLFPIYSLIVLIIISAHSSAGYPYIPALIAGRVILFMLCWCARSNELLTARYNFSGSFPSPYIGPTVWMTYFAGRFPAEVITAVPVSQYPILFDSSWIICPPTRTIASATPPPCCRYLFANRFY